MHVLITLSRFMLGGTETYSVTVAEQLERLGHTVTVHAGEASPHGRDLAASRGVRLRVGDLTALDGVDAVLAQDAESAYLLAGRRPGPRQVFTIHGFSASEHPPDRLTPPPPVVVLNDRVGRRVAALASHPEIVRLRQPIDIERFRPRGAARSRARRVLLLSNYLKGSPLRMLEGICGDLGLELVRLGASGTPTLEPQAEMADADIVVGYGRSVLEAMAMGRAAYVWDHAGGDGWVTPETYPDLEADGFAGAATDAVIDTDRMRADFAAYSPELGAFGFDLVRKHHSANDHGESIVRLLDDASVSAASDDVLETLARLVRLEARASIRVDSLEAEIAQMWEEVQAARDRADAAEGQIRMIEGSRSWRFAEPLRRSAAFLRRR
jgi:hypothetical protein